MATDILTLAGEPLLIEDVDCDLHNWMRAYQSLDDLREFGALPVALQSQRPTSRSNVRGGPGLPLPNYPHGIPPRLNTLYWPSGASRWAYGLFLATGKTAKKIMDAAFIPNYGSTGITLRMDTLETEIYLLPPRPISDPFAGFGMNSRAGTDEDQLWLLPVVDLRFWLQFYNSGNLTVTSTWESLFQAVIPTLSITVDPVNTFYLSPDPVELTRKYDSAGVLLDAMSSSVGQRIVRSLDGTFRSINATNSTFEKLVANMGFGPNRRSGTLIAGDRFPVFYDFTAPTTPTFSEWGDLPEKVTVAFPKYSWFVPWCDGAQYAYDISAPAGSITKTGTKKPIHSTAYADFTGVAATPDNDALLQSLANQIGADYYAWFGQRYDFTFNGIFLWDPTGFDDCIEWSLGRQDDDGNYVARTRVQSTPMDFGVESQLSQDPDKVVLDHFQIGVITAANNLQYGLKYATATIYNHTAGAEAAKDDPPISVRAYPWPSGELKAGDSVWLLWHCEKNAWYALKPSGTSGNNDLVRFRLLEDKPFNVEARATRLDRNKNPVGVEIVVIDTIGDWHGLIDFEGWAVHMADNPNPLEYEIWFLEAPARYIEFELKDYDGDGWAFDNGISPDASIIKQGDAFWGLSPNGIAGGENSVWIYDELLLFPRALKGARGIAVYDERTPDPINPRRGSYRAIICNQQALLCEFHIAEKMCSGDEFVKASTIQDELLRPMTQAPFGQRPTLSEGRSPSEAGRVYNPLGLAGIAGTQGVIAWNESRLRWDIIQMKHFEFTVLLSPTAGVEPESPGDPGACVVPTFQSLKTPLMFCEPPQNVTLYNVVEKEVVTSFRETSTPCIAGSGSGSVGGAPSTPGTCKIEAGLEKICVLKRSAGATDPPRYIDVATFDAQLVVVDVYDDGVCIDQHLAWVFVLCACDSHYENVFCTDLCPSGSGSGSGS